MNLIVAGKLITRVLLCCLISLSFSSILVAQAQQRVHGSVDGHTYADLRFGLRYTFPADLETMSFLPNGIRVGTGERQGGSEFLFAAMEKPNGRVRRGVMITTDPVGTFGARDVPTYLQKEMVLSLGAKEPIRVQSVTINGRRFYRTDAGIGVPIHSYGAQLSTLCSGAFLTFYFSGPTPESVEELVRTLSQMVLSCPTDNE